MTQKFETDFREINPQLHNLYVKMACQNLTAIDSCIKILDNLSSVSILLGPVKSLFKERLHLVETDAAYADADEILREISNQRMEPTYEFKVQSKGCREKSSAEDDNCKGDPEGFDKR